MGQKGHSFTAAGNVNWSSDLTSVFNILFFIWGHNSRCLVTPLSSRVWWSLLGKAWPYELVVQCMDSKKRHCLALQCQDSSSHCTVCIEPGTWPLHNLPSPSWALKLDLVRLGAQENAPHFRGVDLFENPLGLLILSLARIRAERLKSPRRYRKCPSILLSHFVSNSTWNNSSYWEKVHET